MAFPMTLFNNVYARVMQRESMDLADVERLIAEAEARDKGAQPLLKLAIFGANRDPKSNSLRHDANVVAVTGCAGGSRRRHDDNAGGGAAPRWCRHRLYLVHHVLAH
jgi:hypothetical protein